MTCSLPSVALLLGGCTERPHERCGGANYEMSCTAAPKQSDSQRRPSLDGGHVHTTIVIVGTFSVEVLRVMTF